MKSTPSRVPIWVAASFATSRLPPWVLTIKKQLNLCATSELITSSKMRITVSAESVIVPGKSMCSPDSPQRSGGATSNRG